ncbi:MAG: Jag N-terminal domain-containing protein [Deltaproteobacteria bacterium]|jgi:spoIIIJ-associated protein|nr:Jag N-terminal domain-containing protein [Deltaproteobacteria bacterium]
MSKQLVFEGKTTEEAINAAAQTLDTPPELLTFTILSTGSKGIFGLGGRKARIQVTLNRPSDPDPKDAQKILESLDSPRAPVPPVSKGPKEPAGSSSLEGDSSYEPLDLKSRKEAQRTTFPPNQTPKIYPLEGDSFPDSTDISPPLRRFEGQSKDPSFEGLAKDDLREKRPDRKPRRDKIGDKPNLGKPFEPKAKPEDLNDLGSGAQDSQRLKWSNFPIPGPLTKPNKGETLYEGPPDQAMLEAKDLLGEIVQRMGLTAEIKVSRIGPRIILDLESLDNYLLIGRKGASLNALELLVNRIARRKSKECDKSEESSTLTDEELLDRRRQLLEAAQEDRPNSPQPEKQEDVIDENPQIVVDAENYRARRYQGILEKAAFMADKVLQTKKPQIMTQLSPPERRLIHLAIESVPGLTTRSYGFGLVRNLTILPKKPKSAPPKSHKPPEKLN